MQVQAQSVDMITYALNVTESIEISEPSTYNEVISSDETAEWTVAMTEEIDGISSQEPNMRVSEAAQGIENYWLQMGL